VYTKSEVDTKVAEAGSGAVSVTTNQDGTFAIHVGSTDYTINLNHTHENMAKIVKCTEATLPQTFADDTIYVQVDNLTTPTEIESLWLFGLEFQRGFIPETGEPIIISPYNGTEINIGENDGSGVSKTIIVKGKNLTGDITVVASTGLTLSYGQSTGQSSVTIPMAQALLGAQVTIAYSGTGALDDGTLVISQGSSTLCAVDVVVDAVPNYLSAIQLTGTQWLQTDYYPNENSEFEMEVKFTPNSNTSNKTLFGNGVFILRASNDTGSNRWDMNHGNGSSAEVWKLIFHTDSNALLSNTYSQQNFTEDHSIIKLVRSSTNKSDFYFQGTKVGSINAKSGTTLFPLAIGYNYQFEDSGPIYRAFDLTIYRLVISENGTAVRRYMPMEVGGVPGLYDEIQENFISSKTATPVVAINNNQQNS
jgi:hypothetical protein